MRILGAMILITFLVRLASAEAPAAEDGHFSSWEQVPEIIDSMNEADYRQQLEDLHQLTRIKLGFPQTSQCLNDAEHGQYMLQTKQNWKDWWESTGKPVSLLKKQNAKVDRPAFEMAWKFIGSKQKSPDPISPVWIPDAWSLHVSFSNGDYGGREKELWIIERKVGSASLSKLRGDHSKGDWTVVMSEIAGFSPENADHLLKALCYLHLYAREAGEEVPDNEMKGLYYPHATLQLRDGKNGFLWNTEGYDFSKSRPEYGDGESGRSYYFLSSSYPAGEMWKQVAKPTSDQMAPYRKVLSASKPYFNKSADDIIQLFGQHGGSSEKQAMLEWGDKQKTATDPEMDWKIRSDDFGTQMKVNVINSTRSEIQQTQKHIKKLGDRLHLAKLTDEVLFDADRAKERELEKYIAEMLGIEKAEEEAEIQSHPQPLRDLVRVHEHPDDPDLKHLSAAIQSIRNAPDPMLFKQLAKELDALDKKTLLRGILINEHDQFDLKPWDNKLEAIAVAACIDSMSTVNDEALQNLVETLLHVCGGGKIQIQGKDMVSSIEVKKTKDGSCLTLSGADDPLPIKEAQAELQRIYKKSRTHVGP